MITDRLLLGPGPSNPYPEATAAMARPLLGHMDPEFLAVMDNRANYPVLVHCFAGIHRTGTMCAVFRMEYHGWSAFSTRRSNWSISQPRS